MPEDDRLEALRHRWEREPGSRIFLQLAEEYRRHGRLTEAVKTLERGLAAQPGYVSARVALGRCRLELGDAQGASQLLETVLSSDPTQLVANKLLVEACLRLGEADRARDRLDLYMLLNESDPEIDELEKRVLALEKAPKQRCEPSFAPAAPVEAGSAPDSGASPGATVVTPRTSSLKRPDGPIALSAIELAPLHLAALPRPGAARAVAEGAPKAPPSDPFPGLRRLAASEDLTAGIAREGIFRRRKGEPAARTSSAVVEPVVPSMPVWESPVEEGAAPSPDGVETMSEVFAAPAAPAPVSALDTPEPEPPAFALVEEPPLPVAEAAVQLPGTSTPAPLPWWKIPAAEPVASVPVAAEPEVASLAAASPAWSAEPISHPIETPADPGEIELPPVELEAAASPETESELVFAGETEAEPAALGVDEEREALPAFDGQAETSATLGDLYLQQGHIEEAEKAFRAVLARDPGHVQAAAGLDEVGRRRREVSASRLLGQQLPSGLTARKIRVLQGYLERIREGARRHVS